MNQTNLFRFVVIINSLILYIYGCVTFKHGSDNQCIETSEKRNKSILQCIIWNPLVKIKSIECQMEKFNVINISMANLEEMEEFFLNNNETVVKFLQLFKNELYLTTELIIELRNLLSDSDSINFNIDKQWIIEYFGHLSIYDLRIIIYMKADDWNQVNITIHADVNDIREPKTIELYLQKPGDRRDCAIYITPPVLYNTSYLKDSCRDFITFIDKDGDAMPWPTTKIRKVIHSWNRATNTIFKPFIPVTIRNTIYRREEPSGGHWAYILSPTVVIIIVLGFIIYCTIMKNRKTSISNSYSEPVATAPAYTYSVPMYHSPAYTQK